MPYVEKEIERLYWTIGEVARKLDEAPSAIRFWDNYFELHIGHSRRGYRQFTKSDIADLKEIKRLLKEEGYRMDGAKRKFKEKILNLKPIQI